MHEAQCQRDISNISWVDNNDKNVEDKIMEGEFKVVYVTPEKFFNENGTTKAIFSNLLKRGRVGLLALDKVHLVRTWNSFRYNEFYGTIIIDFF